MKYGNKQHRNDMIPQITGNT